MIRHSDWEQRLQDFLAPLHNSAELKFGAMDCAIGFAADAVKAMTGKDLAKDFRGKYKSLAGAHRALKEKGRGTLKATVDALLEPKPIAMAMRGDVVMKDGCLGICLGPFSVFLPDEGQPPGLIRFPTLSCEKAWAV